MNDNLRQLANALAAATKTVSPFLTPGQAVVLLPNRSVLIIPLDDDAEIKVEPSETKTENPVLRQQTPSTTREVPPLLLEGVTSIVQFLLRKEILPVGRSIRSLSEDLNMKRNRVERLVRAATDCLPFVMKKAYLSPVRIRPGMGAEAEAWLQRPTKRSRPKASGLSESSFLTVTIKIAYILIKHYPSEVNTSQILQETGVNSAMLHRVRHRLKTGEIPFISVSPVVRGASPALTITDIAAAEAWLSKQTEPPVTSTN